MSRFSLGVELVESTFEQVTVGTSASLLTALSSRPYNSTTAILYPEADIRFRCDGTDPTVAVGIVLDAKMHVFENQGRLLDKMSVISGTGSNVKLNIQWCKSQ